MMKAAAPITGGMKGPPLAEMAVRLAAKMGENPFFFISGIVSDPTAAASATGLPEIIPIRRPMKTDALALPPRVLPRNEAAMSAMRTSPPIPDCVGEQDEEKDKCCCDADRDAVHAFR